VYYVPGIIAISGTVGYPAAGEPELADAERVGGSRHGSVMLPGYGPMTFSLG